MADVAQYKFKLNDPRLWFYRALVLRVIDGDTIVVLCDKGLNNYSVMKLRLAGIDAPELRPRAGSTESKEAEKLLGAKATARLEELVGGREVMIKTEKTGKFGRYLASVYPPASEKSANDVLLEEGLAVVYGEKRPWRSE